MFSKNLFAIVLAALFINSCTVFKKSHDSGNLPVLNLDTVITKAAPPEQLNYQASFTRVNDIIHTKVDVSFDWSKQYMYGKATITVKPYFYSVSSFHC